MKLRHYFVITNNDFHDFIQEVNSYLDKGWTPIGGFTVNSYNKTLVYHQAIAWEASLNNDEGPEPRYPDHKR